MCVMFAVPQDGRPGGFRIGHAECPGKQTHNRGLQGTLVYELPDLDGESYFTSGAFSAAAQFFLVLTGAPSRQ